MQAPVALPRCFAKILCPDFGFGSLREFRPRCRSFTVIHQVLPQNCASSVRKIYSQITLVQLCGIALIPPLCGDTLISDAQFSIFHFEREGFDGHCSLHCTLCYALYQKHRPVSDAAGTGLLDLRHVPHLLGNAQPGDGTGRLDEKPVCTGCRDHSRSGGIYCARV